MRGSSVTKALVRVAQDMREATVFNFTRPSIGIARGTRSVIREYPARAYTRAHIFRSRSLHTEDFPCIRVTVPMFALPHFQGDREDMIVTAQCVWRKLERAVLIARLSSALWTVREVNRYRSDVHIVLLPIINPITLTPLMLS